MFGLNFRRNLELTFGKILPTKPFNMCGLRYISIREPLQPLKRCPKWVCVEDAIKIINSEHLVFIQGGAATPNELIRAMTEHGVCNNLRGVRLIHMGLEGDAPFSSPEFESTVF